MKPTGRYCFCLFHPHDQKSKQNHQIASSRAKTRSRQSQTCVKYRDIIIWIKRNTYVYTRDLKILNKKMSKKRLIFKTLSSISPSFHMVCLQPNGWLESYVCYGLFGTMIWGSHIISHMLRFLPSHNTLSVTHSDTAF